MKEEAVYTKKYLVTNEVLNAITHGIGAILSIVGMILLIMKAVNTGTTLELVSYCIYGFSQFLLYLSSTLYHSLIFTRARRIFKIFWIIDYLSKILFGFNSLPFMWNLAV